MMPQAYTLRSLSVLIGSSDGMKLAMSSPNKFLECKSTKEQHQTAFGLISET